VISYDATDRWLRSRLSMPTSLKSAGIAEKIPAELRARAFFSAQVEAARTLAELREMSDAYSRGEISRAEARSRVKDYLGGGNNGGDLTDLRSSRRLNLILDQNRRMAQAVGRHEVSNDPAIKERWPYYRYIVGPNARDEHAALDGLVLAKDDPFWASHTPPWDFNCNCDLEDCDAEEAEQYGGVAKEPPPVGDAESGFRFNPADALGEFDLESISDDAVRTEVSESMRLAYGDQVSDDGDGQKLFYRPNLDYVGYQDLDLPSVREWRDVPALPSEVNPQLARSMLDEGMSIDAGDDRTVALGREVLRHWESETGKSTAEINGRLAKLEMATATLTKPAEVWEQATQRVYIQMFERESGSRVGCVVYVTDDNVTRTYFPRDRAGIDRARQGIAETMKKRSSG